MTSKYDTLNALGRHLPVPTLTALSDADFRMLWRDYDERAAAIAELLRTVQVTAAAFLDQHIARIEALAELDWNEHADLHLRRRLDEAGLAGDARLAVRSSASVEDGAHHSFAGIFSTRLDVRGLDALKAAILEVWRSGVSRAAIVERVRAGNAGMRIGMTVILQRMVEARVAGVAFSADPVTGKPQTWIELVESLGDAMVSGAEKGRAARLTEDGQLHAAGLEAHHPLLRDVAALARAAADAIGAPADIEWAADGERLWLLQARPITTVAGAVDAGPCFEWVPLYASDDDALTGFRPLPAFAQYFRSKRKPLADFAALHGVPAGNAMLVRANRAGFASARERRDAWLARFTLPTVVLDFSDAVRQQILPREALPGRLDELLGESASNFVVREFVAGDSGLITQACEDGSVVCEWSADGLLAINRGIATTSTATLSGGATPGVDDAQRLFAITHEAVDRFGPIQLEWVRTQRGLHLIDFSPLATLAVLDEDDELRIISPGFAAGLPVVVGTDSHLEDVSVSATVSINAIPSAESLGPALARLEADLREHGGQAIVVSPRPYAALAALIPHARGFVFEQASMLCHLSILLREHGVPAVESARLYHLGLSGARVSFAAAQAA
ncbi:PEP/pyruvate-binding domain-containing protein [Burkholderia plantarii]|uniref:Phosphoenolpyruvate synthase PpsA n=1 Tax=Burkholderia plantarii TaxID=41899 RepID=A0A0B6RUL7_BURPL|nr:PEP/pyruvate-binding domain-containing protein [Burkholderia plantarii]AJK49042.1 phosphoenolpyruvate synthase PpsA [Burkholderia plantarii]